ALSISLTDASGHRTVASRTDLESGEFEIPAPGGAHTLNAQAYDFQGIIGEANVALDIASDINGIQVTLGASMVIPIQVKTAASTPRGIHAQSGPNTRPAYANFPMWFTRTDYNDDQPMQFVGPDNSGRLIVQNLNSGTYRALFKPSSPWYVQSAQC